MKNSEQISQQPHNEMPPLLKESNSNVTHEKLATFKLSNLIDRWILPIDKINLKLWIQKSNIEYSNPSLGIGIGTRNKPKRFAFVILDNDSINWLETSIKESKKSFIKINQSKNNSSDNSILWLEKKELDKVKKFGIFLSIVTKGNNKSFRFMINSRASLSADLNLDDMNWLLETLNMAKYILDGILKHE